MREMQQTKKLMKPMYNLLIKYKFNNFSVLQARDELLKMSDFIGDANEARKFIHRQVNHLVASGYLDVTGTGRNKKFTKTARFYQVKFVEKPKHQICFSKKSLKLQLELDPTSDYQILIEERNQYHSELAMSQAEAQEYETLLRRVTSAVSRKRVYFASIKNRSHRTFLHDFRQNESTNSLTR